MIERQAHHIDIAPGEKVFERGSVSVKGFVGVELKIVARYGRIQLAVFAPRLEHAEHPRLEVTAEVTAPSEIELHGLVEGIGDSGMRGIRVCQRIEQRIIIRQALSRGNPRSAKRHCRIASHLRVAIAERLETGGDLHCVSGLGHVRSLLRAMTGRFGKPQASCEAGPAHSQRSRPLKQADGRGCALSGRIDSGAAIGYDDYAIMPKWYSQGTHRYYCEGDLAYFEVHGPFTLADAQCMFAVAESIEREHGYVLSAFDNRDGPGLTPDARRYTSEKNRQRMVPGATAVIGASVAVRTMAILLINVSRLAGKPSSPVHFCATHQEAIDWLSAQRQQLRAKPT